MLHIDHHARRARRRGLDPVHVRVVADTVLDHEPRLADLLGDARARFERVRVGIRVVLDRGDSDVPAADLRDHVGVLILGPDRHDLAGASGHAGVSAAGEKRAAGRRGA